MRFTSTRISPRADSLNPSQCAQRGYWVHKFARDRLYGWLGPPIKRQCPSLPNPRCLASPPDIPYDSDMQNCSRRLLLPIFLFLTSLQAENNLKFGQPACAGPVLDKDFFVISYDPGHKIPTWVGHALTKEESLLKATSRTGSFRADAAEVRK
jgi:hypothetical protein